MILINRILRIYKNVIHQNFCSQDLKLKIYSVLKLFHNNKKQFINEIISNSNNQTSMAKKPNYRLSNRELEVVELIIKGCPKKEITDKHFIANNI